MEAMKKLGREAGIDAWISDMAIITVIVPTIAFSIMEFILLGHIPFLSAVLTFAIVMLLAKVTVNLTHSDDAVKDETIRSDYVRNEFDGFMYTLLHEVNPTYLTAWFNTGLLFFAAGTGSTVVMAVAVVLAVVFIRWIALCVPRSAIPAGL